MPPTADAVLTGCDSSVVCKCYLELGSIFDSHCCVAPMPILNLQRMRARLSRDVGHLSSKGKPRPE
jgi:hypothetical protein